MTISSISTYVRQELSGHRHALAALAALRAAAGVLTILGALCTAHLLAAVVNNVFSIEKAVPLFAVLLFVVLGNLCLSCAWKRKKDQWMLQTEERLRERIHAALLARSPLATEPETGGQLLGLACESVERLDRAWETILPAALDFAVLLPLYLLVFACTDGWTALLALLTLPIAPFLLYLIGLVTKERSAAEYRAMTHMGAAFAELLRAIPMMKLFGREKAARCRVAAASNRFCDAALAVLRTAFVSSFALELITTLSIALIAVSLGLRLVAGDIAFEPAFFVLLLAPAFYAPLVAGGTAFHAAMESGEAMKHILAFVDDVPLTRPVNQGMTSAQQDTNATLAFQNVTASYPGCKAPAVRDVTFSVRRGRITALQGTSGAGKSTIFALALRFLTPRCGNILRPVESHNRDTNLFPIAYVPQEPHIFHGTLRDNLLLGRTATDAMLLHAMEAAGLSSLLSQVTNGLGTMLGEGSRALSNGERKRLGLARALVVSAELYLFDEITAGLDEENEQRVLQTIQKLRNAPWKPAILLASHRETTLAIGDKVVTMDGGTMEHPLISKQSLTSSNNSSSIVVNAPKESFKPLPPPLGEVAPKGAERVTQYDNLDSIERIENPARTLPSPPRIRSAPSPRGEASNDCMVLFSLLHTLPIQLTFLALLSGLLADAASVLLLGASAWLIASAAFHPHLSALALAITGVRAAGIGRAAFRYLDRYLSHRAVFSLLTQLRLAVYGLACAHLPERHPGPASGTFLQAAISGVDELRDACLRAFFPLVRMLVLVAATAFLAAQEHPALAIVPLLCVLLQACAAVLLQANESEDAAEARYRSVLSDVFAGRAEIVAFAAEASFTQQMNAQAQAITVARRKTLARSAIADALSEALPSLAWLAMFFVLASHLPAATAPADAVHLAVTVMVLQTLMELFAPLAGVVRRMRPAVEKATSLFAIAPAEVKPCTLSRSTRDTPRRSRGPSPLTEGGRNVDTLRSLPYNPDNRNHSYSCHPATSNVCNRSIEPHNFVQEKDAGETAHHLQTKPVLSVASLAFSYTSSPVFQNVSFYLHPHEKLLLLGESGAGKTTLFHLLTRLWEPDGGSLELFGRPYRQCSIAEVRAAFAAATQAGFVFSGSIRENFDRLLPDASDTCRERALAIACCDEFIAELPQGIDTPLGEDGARLSGGQRQRVLVALTVCALLEHPEKILLLDEPTTGLDHTTGERLLANLMHAFPSQAMILILHDHGLAEKILARDDARAVCLPYSQATQEKK